MQVVIQEEETGCGIAAVANIVDKTYSQMKARANAMGIYADDKALWSDTDYVRKLLLDAGVEVSQCEIPFKSWETLPNTTLLAIKHHVENGVNYWHWVVFKRNDNQDVVLDSASYLPNNVRTDFESIQPKWFIEVKCNQHL